MSSETTILPSHSWFKRLKLIINENGRKWKTREDDNCIAEYNNKNALFSCDDQLLFLLFINMWCK